MVLRLDFVILDELPERVPKVTEPLGSVIHIFVIFAKHPIFDCDRCEHAGED